MTARTKRQVILDAFAEIGLASDVFDLTPEELQRALSRMDSMMAVWESKGIQVGYNRAGLLDDDSGLPEAADTAVFLNLAVALAPGKGKALSVETKAAARDAFDVLLIAAAQPQEQQIKPGLSMGAGNKWVYGVAGTPYSNPTATAPLTAEEGGSLVFAKG